MLKIERQGNKKLIWSFLIATLSVVIGICAMGFADNSVSIETIRDAAKKGDAKAQYALGHRYLFGKDVAKDPSQAFLWFHKSADQGHARAQAFLGNAYNYGNGANKDEAEAVKWYLKAANQGDAMAQNTLGLAYKLGQLGLQENSEEAFCWWLKAAKQAEYDEQGTFAKTQLNVFMRVETGTGKGNNSKCASDIFRLFLSDAERGDPEAQLRIGRAYLFGWGVKSNFTEAAEWFRKAAEQGDDDAQRMLGRAYYLGEGVSKDVVESSKWTLKAAEQGHSFAQYSAAVNYYGGFGVPQDFVLAHMWANLAVTNGEERAKKLRDKLAKIMLPVQLYEAQSLARNWQPKTYTQAKINKNKGTQNIVSTGTGFIISAKGEILTVHHVVKGAKKLRVQLRDGRLFDAKVVKVSQSTDLAVLKIDELTPNHLNIRSNNKLQIGDRVFTIGYPVMSLLGSESKYSEGSISSLSGPGGDTTFLQISVPVQPGNSGGPLVKEDGQLVGVVTATAAVESFFKKTGALPQNINWAINAAYAVPLIGAIKDDSIKPLSHREAIDIVRKATVLITQMGE